MSPGSFDDRFAVMKMFRWWSEGRRGSPIVRQGARWNRIMGKREGNVKSVAVQENSGATGVRSRFERDGY